jgi:hypothetical protein
MSTPQRVQSDPPCPRAGRVIGGCRWEARFDEQPRTADFEVTGCGPGGTLRSLLYYRTYVRDICTRCGRTIERTEAGR